MVAIFDNYFPYRRKVYFLANLKAVLQPRFSPKNYDRNKHIA
jgi:hypothetical protein